MFYEVLATLWNGPANDVDVARAIEDRNGLPCSRNRADQYLRLLLTCDYIAVRPRHGLPHYVLTERGSALLARYAEAAEHTEISA